MQHFQLILIIIGMLAILAVLIHGYIVSRKEKTPVTDNSLDSEELSEEIEADNQDNQLSKDIRIIRAYREDEDESCDFSVPPETGEVEEIKFAAELSHQEPACEEAAGSVYLNTEPPVSAESETFIGENRSEEKLDSDVENKHVELSDSEQQQPVQEKPEHFIFNVVAKEGTVVRGHELLQFFLTAGFRFGEMSIFHRHLYSDGTGPVLFSIANMMAPGVFDLENMEQFRSEGVSFFLTVPNNDINIKKAFDMMLFAVEQMAEEFDCMVLNENRKPLTETEFRKYHKRLLRYI